MERCPLCRARRKDGPDCPRCGTDLTLIYRIEAQALTLQRLAIANIVANQRQQAQQLLQQSLHLKQTLLAQTLSEMLVAESC